METTLQPGNAAALFAAMAVLAAVPSVSVLAVTARAASAGFAHGAATALGIVAADILFVLLAVFGLVLLIEALGDAFVLVEYAAGGYLVWLGVRQWRARSRGPGRGDGDGASLAGSFLTGLLLTLGDQKAVLFYLGFLPAFLDLDALTTWDVGLVAAITLCAVGGVKLGYAYAADRAGARLGGDAGRALTGLAAAVMVGAGLWLVVAAVSGGAGGG